MVGKTTTKTTWFGGTNLVIGHVKRSPPSSMILRWRIPTISIDLRTKWMTQPLPSQRGYRRFSAYFLFPSAQTTALSLFGSFFMSRASA